MKVKELVSLLQSFDQELEVICTRYSDYTFVSPKDISVVQALQGPDKEWLTTHHPSMSEEDNAKLRNYLHFKGN